MATYSSKTSENQYENLHRNTHENRLGSISEMSGESTDNNNGNVNVNQGKIATGNKENENRENANILASKRQISDSNNSLNLSSIQSNDINSNNSVINRSNVQLDASFVEIHPLSNSFRDTNLSGLNNDLRTSNPQRRTSLQNIPAQIPIIGYEVMEERARFTIYKLRIDDPRTGLSWMVFRRYTDFVRLYQKLKIVYKNLALPLPEKRLFRNNFDPIFLDDRARGLQIFVNAVVKKLSSDRDVREFFCLDEPPPVGDSEPEAQALFGALEDTVGTLKNQLRQQEEALKYMRQKVFYLEEKMKNCSVCNPLGSKDQNLDQDSSSNGS